MSKFGDKIKILRKQKGVTQVNLGKKLGISQAAIAKIESGSTYTISIELGKKIAEALQVNFEELFDIENQKTIKKDKSLIAKENIDLKNKLSELEKINNGLRVDIQFQRTAKEASNSIFERSKEDYKELKALRGFIEFLQYFEFVRIESFIKEYPRYFNVNSFFPISKLISFYKKYGNLDAKRLLYKHIDIEKFEESSTFQTGGFADAGNNEKLLKHIKKVQGIIN
jgi:transcriptional regulator with XRE-family HTH domain